ncbi:hypothetical protein BOSE62_40287 [Bosea sp. 62]|nr:hypothetical protein BOSE46_120501 [Bosea sp. 46]CAD5262824.1 hypothetical protein BOSE21B_110731 [Bosea sp. 21B]CAD5277585.1 hypothetical protein BOSE7B_40487 [Bosea sp. 7B]VVT58828.1 hypothetical protein BOS5A_200780 [Bosea sp. EC-HK365B]VXB61252.1 hypothetical protein BOSE29B_110664 [Bosea sp. 29B]VXC02423.1 hypothetical protein BOSE125_160457 [Bosea sp. 125]VXC38593.1 hypothetical protein BOSE62_40287 [Bosea sp. 62]VXC79529.1 hypothetical protein BOSE127_50193 [Bosea sp. 127]
MLGCAPSDARAMQKKRGKVNILELVPICLHRKAVVRTVSEQKMGTDSRPACFNLVGSSQSRIGEE